MQKKKTKVEFIPLIVPCTYHHKKEDGVCRNCNDTMKYKDGYYMIHTDEKGNKSAFFVDTIK